MAIPVRRVVTGHDENGTAIVIEDSAATNILERPERPGVALTNLWRTQRTPAPWDEDGDPVAGKVVLSPPENGSVLRILEFWPEDREALAKLDTKAAFGAMGAADNLVEDTRHPFMHKTDTVDYAIVIEGEIDMLMDESSVHLKAGDVLIQRGTNHAWSNRGTDVCRIAFVLIDGTKE
ncbi:MAG: cupin domain-containing protein [Rhodospirillaceae bacterium]|jgi:mannose-6-phosphate isomerase-like protein (cupin superfamily)|nr:cupin domain-containing protein [Rhodospirillales bacterium]MBT3904159.1 cupin domain-containing protein [Rhodospirillaceae bacterium]MBT4700356.1 cupin domain-containing protein [Rhodospirillaceae bacterium]MBT5035441.1 cupin domain-containing protein [Rhodospirillaceae bacterium]MBT6218583.1 cupin domain-containing protein [Rhodospirillaceae bacterium]